MELIYIDNLYVFRCEFIDRLTPKTAGFNWHLGDKCKRRECPACEAGLEKVWYTQNDNVAVLLINYADEAAHQQLFLDAKAREETLAASRATDADIEVPSPDGLSYLPYQRAGIAFADARPGVLIGDEMGLGKTQQSIGLMNLHPEYRKILIICPANLKVNWHRELKRWLVDDYYISICHTKYPFPKYSNIVIINYDILHKYERELRAQDWDLLVIDEAHYIKNKSSRRSKAVYGYKKGKKGKKK